MPSCALTVEKEGMQFGLDRSVLIELIGRLKEVHGQRRREISDGQVRRLLGRAAVPGRARRDAGPFECREKIVDQKTALDRCSHVH